MLIMMDDVLIIVLTFASQLVDKLAFPEKHDMSLKFSCFFL